MGGDATIDAVSWAMHLRSERIGRLLLSLLWTERERTSRGRYKGKGRVSTLSPPFQLFAGLWNASRPKDEETTYSRW